MVAVKNRIAWSLLYPVLFIALLWIIKFIEYYYDVRFVIYGLKPRTIDGLLGIVTFPLIHGSFSHLISNSIPLLILGTFICYSYRQIQFEVFFWIYLMTGVWLWAAGRDSYHIGASGLVYGFVCFLFFSGIFRKDNKLLALSMLVTFIYGSLVWGVFPLVPTISWEGHLLGSLSGLITAFFYRKEGPQPPRYQWMDEEENEDEQNNGTSETKFEEDEENNLPLA